MSYLSPAELVERAPAAKPMIKVQNGLIDTSAFVKYIRKRLGHRPVMAVQSNPHLYESEGRSKAKIKVTSRLQQSRERQGRHFIVMAGPTGQATILLNSHLVRRKAWLAAGFWRKGQVLIGVAIPLQRWRGFEAAVDELERYRGLMNEARMAMRTCVIGPGEVRKLAQTVSNTAYLPGHNAIAPDELVDAMAGRESLYGALLGMHAVILKGNSKPAEADKRKVKPVKGPDALMQLGNAVFNAGVEVSGGPVALPAYRKT
jgi:hypothetical protein